MLISVVGIYFLASAIAQIAFVFEAILQPQAQTPGLTLSRVETVSLRVLNVVLIGGPGLFLVAYRESIATKLVGPEDPVMKFPNTGDLHKVGLSLLGAYLALSNLGPLSSELWRAAAHGNPWWGSLIGRAVQVSLGLLLLLGGGGLSYLWAKAHPMGRAEGD